MAFLTNFQTFLNFSRKKNRWNFKIFFSKIVHRKGCFGKIKKKFDFSLLIFDSRAASLKEQENMFFTVRLTSLIFQQYKIGFKVELKKKVKLLWNTMGNTKVTNVFFQCLDARMPLSEYTEITKHQSQLQPQCSGHCLSIS